MVNNLSSIYMQTSKSFIHYISNRPYLFHPPSSRPSLSSVTSILGDDISSLTFEDGTAFLIVEASFSSSQPPNSTRYEEARAASSSSISSSFKEDSNSSSMTEEKSKPLARKHSSEAVVEVKVVVEPAVDDKTEVVVACEVPDVDDDELDDGVADNGIITTPGGREGAKAAPMISLALVVKGATLLMVKGVILLAIPEFIPTLFEAVAPRVLNTPTHVDKDWSFVVNEESRATLSFEPKTPPAATSTNPGMDGAPAPADDVPVATAPTDPGKPVAEPNNPGFSGFIAAKPDAIREEATFCNILLRIKLPPSITLLASVAFPLITPLPLATQLPLATPLLLTKKLVLL